MIDKTYILVPSNEKCGPVTVALELYRSISENKCVFLVGLRNSKRECYPDIKVLIWYKFLVALFTERNKKIVINSHGLRPDILCFVLKFLFGIRWISTLHIDIKADMRFNYKSLGVFTAYFWSKLLWFADDIVAVNPYLAKKLSSEIGRYVDFIVNGRSALSFNASKIEERKLNFDPINPSIGYMGNFIELKNVLSISKIGQKGNKPLILAGRGPLLNQLKLDLLHNKIKFSYLGYLDDIDVFFSKIDILILPSLTEALPLVVLEAAARGIPSIITDLPQFDGVFDGFCMRIMNWDAPTFQSALTYLSDNYAQFSEQATKEWIAKFSPEAMGLSYSSKFYN